MHALTLSTVSGLKTRSVKSETKTLAASARGLAAKPVTGYASPSAGVLSDQIAAIKAAPQSAANQAKAIKATASVVDQAQAYQQTNASHLVLKTAKLAGPGFGGAAAGGAETDTGPTEDEIEAALSQSFGLNLMKAVGHAMTMHHVLAHFRDIKIMSVTAIGGPGCLTGPNLEPLIRNAPTVASGMGIRAQMRDAVAEAVGAAFAAWRSKVMVPGLAWYPAFAAWPGPYAGPIPNVPTPLISCPSAKMAEITTKWPLLARIQSATPAGLVGARVGSFSDALAAALSVSFGAWLASQQVMNVMGRGEVPTFRPPFAPLGTVVGGSVIEAPTHFPSPGAFPTAFVLPA